MIDPGLVRARLSDYVDSCKRRGIGPELANKILAAAGRVEASRATEAQLATQRRQLAQLWREARSQEGASSQAEARALRAAHRAAREQLRKAEGVLRTLLERAPNFLDPNVITGDDDENQVLRTGGRIPEFQAAPRTHLELGLRCGIVSVRRDGSASGRRTYWLKDDAVRLRQALLALLLQREALEDFILVSPPWLARPSSLFTSGFAPFHEAQSFKVEQNGLALIGTSEQAILGMHMGEVLEELPLAYLGESKCFRTEIGGSGRDVTGLVRVHEFYKVEQLVFCHPDEGEKWHQACLDTEEWLLAQLELPYRIVRNVTGDMSPSNYLKYDTEVWMPSELGYREVTSNVYLRDYQSRRGNIRYRYRGEQGYPHTVSATAFCDRLLFGIFENYQTSDGGIRIPERLVPFMGGQREIPPRHK